MLVLNSSCCILIWLINYFFDHSSYASTFGGGHQVLNSSKLSFDTILFICWMFKIFYFLKEYLFNHVIDSLFSGPVVWTDTSTGLMSTLLWWELLFVIGSLWMMACSNSHYQHTPIQFFFLGGRPWLPDNQGFYMISKMLTLLSWSLCV